MIRTFAFLLLIAGTLCAAPVPTARPALHQVGPGTYWCSWNGYQGRKTILYGNGKFEMDFGQERWQGKWRWDRSNRTLTIVKEHYDTGIETTKFSWKMNRILEGEGVAIASIRLWRVGG